ncbi:hypothetical protein BGW42_004445, partial [Actinomortierella wolfii]
KGLRTRYATLQRRIQIANTYILSKIHVQLSRPSGWRVGRTERPQWYHLFSDIAKRTYSLPTLSDAIALLRHPLKRKSQVPYSRRNWRVTVLADATWAFARHSPKLKPPEDVHSEPLDSDSRPYDAPLPPPQSGPSNYLKSGADTSSDEIPLLDYTLRESRRYLDDSKQKRCQEAFDASIDESVPV